MKFGTNIVIDLETSTKTNYKRKANPFDPENYIVYAGWQVLDGQQLPKQQRFGAKGMPAGWFGRMLKNLNPRLLIGLNIKFDLQYLIRDPEDYREYMAWVVRGGNVWDTQLAEYLLNGMQVSEHMLSMDEIAPRYGGNVKFDEVKLLWQASIETVDIDPALMTKYLIGTEHLENEADRELGDIGNTRVIFEGQYARARAAGQVKSLLVNFGSLLCTTEMERNGMAVDKARGRELARDLEAEIAVLVEQLAGFLPDDLPFDFNWGSARQKSALIFGGTVTYKKWLPHLTEDGQMQYAMKTVTGYATVYNPTKWIPEPDEGWSDEERSRLVTFASGKNAGEIKTKKIKVPNLDKPKGAIQDVPYTFKGYTKPEKKWAGSTPGQYSTGADVIEELGNRNIPFLKALAKRTGLAKDLTTYFITLDPKTGEEVGMLTLVQADGIIHHMLNHTSTVTGRFSSSNPNLQNLPKGNKSKVKTIFVSRFAGGYIIQSDFSSLEVYVQAILTRCVNLIADLRKGLDMHCVRVSQKEGISYEEALKRCKDEDNEFFAEWSYKRTKAKEFSFQRAYGAGADAIADSTGMEVDEVKALISAEEERYPEVVEFNDRLMAHLEDCAEDTGIYVQHPELPGVTCHLRQAGWRAPDNSLFMWRMTPAPEFIAKKPASRGGKISSFSPTQTKNYPVQGTGGTWAKAAMWLAIREYYRKGNWGNLAMLVNQVHDALYSDAAPEVAYEAAVVLHACMEEASAFMEWYFGWDVPVPVPSDTKWGANMGDEKSLPDTFAADVAEHRKYIRQTYMNNYVMNYERELHGS